MFPVISSKNRINNKLRLNNTNPNKATIPINRYMLTCAIPVKVDDVNIIPPIKVTTTVAKIPKMATYSLCELSNFSLTILTLFSKFSVASLVLFIVSETCCEAKLT